MRLLLAALACLVVALFARSGEANSVKSVSDAAILSSENPALLSTFGFFNASADRPADNLWAYSLNTPLFSDYAEKRRFIYLPKASRISINAQGRVEFPVGAALIKNFGYADSMGKLKILETRLLLRRAEGWTALPYVWRADGKEADLKLGGARLPVAFMAPDGTDMAISYAVPNKNQCKQCHANKERLMPIGPVWQNMVFENARTKKRLAEFASFPRNGLFPDAIWNDPKTGSVAARALSYLRINCGHCHKPGGSASNSGLFFDDLIGGETALGIGKRPVAAGRGSGNFDFVIEPGHPERSILIHRMKSTDPGVAMPELGRASVHKEGVSLLEQWISEMPSKH